MFDNIEDFSDFVRLAYYRDSDSKSWSDFIEAHSGDRKLLEDWLLRRNLIPDRQEKIDTSQFALDASYQEVFDDLFSQFCGLWKDFDRGVFSERFRFVTCQSESLGARVIQSPCRKFVCVAIDSGLITFLWKTIKFKVAIKNPEFVRGYSRDIQAENLRRQLFEDFQEFLLHAAATKSPKGPSLTLDQRVAPETSVSIEIFEKFIICHEMAHALNGDIPEFADASDGFNRACDVFFQEVDSHEWRKEIYADCMGFTLLLIWESMRGRGRKITAEIQNFLLSLICNFFTMLSAIDAVPSQTKAPASHPPIELRISKLQEMFTWREGGAAEGVLIPIVLLRLMHARDGLTG